MSSYERLYQDTNSYGELFRSAYLPCKFTFLSDDTIWASIANPRTRSVQKHAKKRQRRRLIANTRTRSVQRHGKRRRRCCLVIRYIFLILCCVRILASILHRSMQHNMNKISLPPVIAAGTSSLPCRSAFHMIVCIHMKNMQSITLINSWKVASSLPFH